MKIKIFTPMCLMRIVGISIAIGMYGFIQVGIAQTVSANTGTANASATVQPPVVTPLQIADESFALAEGLVRELRNGGYVLFIRNGAVIPTTTDLQAPGAWWQNCQTTQRLSPEAQPRARAIGDALRRQQIAVYEVLTSEFCRSYDTGVHLGLIPPIRTPALNDLVAYGALPSLVNYGNGVKDILSRATPPRTNRILIGHALPSTLIHPVLGFLPEGHTAVFKPEGNNQFHFLTTLSPGQWQWIGKQNISLIAGAPPPPQVVPVPPQSAAPLIDPAKELKGIELVRALRQGGFNLYMRHAQATVGQDGSLLQKTYWWEDCSIQRNMSDMGREQAKKVGAGIRSINVPVDHVMAAQFCRTQETAHLLGLGAIEVTEDLNHQIGQRAGFDINTARFKRLAEMPAKGMNNVLVSHTHGSPRNEERIMGGLQEGEIVVYKPDGKGGSEPIARVPVTDWEMLAKLVASAKS